MTACTPLAGIRLYGFGAAGATPTISMSSGSTSFVADVDTFRLEPEGVVAGQNGIARLALLGVKAGETTLTYTVRGDAAPRTARIVVLAVTPEQAAQQGKQVWDKISNVLNEPVLAIDWQDAAALRGNAEAIQRVLATLRSAADTWGYTRAENDARLLYAIIGYIKDHPEVTTLRQAIAGLRPDLLTRVEYTPTGNRCGGRQKFAFLYDFAQGYGTFTDVVSVSALVIAATFAAVATVLSAGAAAPASALVAVGISAATAASFTGAAAIAGAVATAVGLLAEQMPRFAADPDRLVASLGYAVCAAINENALPRRARFVDKFRVKADKAAHTYRINLTVAEAATDPTIRAEWMRKAAAAKAEGQAALQEMLGLDDPAFFSPAQNARMAETRHLLNAGDQLVIAETTAKREQVRQSKAAAVALTTPPPSGSTVGPSITTTPGGSGAGGSAGGGGDEGKTESKGVPGWVWAAGAVAVLGGGFLLLRPKG